MSIAMTTMTAPTMTAPTMNGRTITAPAMTASARRRPVAAVASLTADGRPIDAAYVIRRLEEAGAALLALPNSGWTTRMKSSSLEIVRLAAEAYGWTDARVRPPVPQADAISRMDQAMGWLRLVPDDRFVVRRIVGARSLVHPLTERHLFPWRRLGTALGADHKAVQRWHAEGIDLIVASLLRGER